MRHVTHEKTCYQTAQVLKVICLYRPACRSFSHLNFLKMTRAKPFGESGPLSHTLLPCFARATTLLKLPWEKFTFRLVLISIYTRTKSSVVLPAVIAKVYYAASLSGMCGHMTKFSTIQCGKLISAIFLEPEPWDSALSFSRGISVSRTGSLPPSWLIELGLLPVHKVLERKHPRL